MEMMPPNMFNQPQHDMERPPPDLLSAPQQSTWFRDRRQNDKENGRIIEGFIDEMDRKLNKWKTKFRAINRKNGYTGTMKYTLANFLFLLVIAGTEMDMAGLFLSAPTYLKYDSFFEFLLVFNIISFVLPLLLVTLLPFVGMCCSQNSEQHFESFWSSMVHNAQTDDGGSDKPTFLNSFLTRVNPHGGSMQLYHWVPGLRFYVIVKANYSPTDVDALFRVNSISSFTFGVFQIVGIMATCIKGEPITLYVTINIITQILNWLLTMLYFGTNIAIWMGIAGTVRTMKGHYRGIMMEYSRLQASHIDEQIQGSNGSSDKDMKIRRMHEVVLAELEKAYFGLETPMRGGRASLVGYTPFTRIGASATRHVAGKIRDGQEETNENTELSREVFRNELKTLRPIDMHVCVDILKEQAITCYR